jgi:hypothetical protein
LSPFVLGEVNGLAFRQKVIAVELTHDLEDAIDRLKVGARMASKDTDSAPDPALEAPVDQWRRLAMEDGELDVLYGKWFR